MSSPKDTSPAKLPSSSVSGVLSHWQTIVRPSLVRLALTLVSGTFRIAAGCRTIDSINLSTGLLGNQQAERVLANHFLAAVAKHGFGGRIPIENAKVRIYGHVSQRQPLDMQPLALQQAISLLLGPTHAEQRLDLGHRLLWVNRFGQDSRRMPHQFQSRGYGVLSRWLHRKRAAQECGRLSDWLSVADRPLTR